MGALGGQHTASGCARAFLLIFLRVVFLAQPAFAFILPTPMHREGGQQVSRRPAVIHAFQISPRIRDLMPRIRMSGSGDLGQQQVQDEGHNCSHYKAQERDKANKSVQRDPTHFHADDESLDPSQSQFKSAALRKEANDLDSEAHKLRTEAASKEKVAGLLRIAAWREDGVISNITEQIQVEDRVLKDIIKLDLMAADFIDDNDKWETYHRHRKFQLQHIANRILLEMEVNEKLKKGLVEIQDIFKIEALNEGGEITSAGWGLVFLSAVTSICMGYALILSAYTIVATLITSRDPFAGL